MCVCAATNPASSRLRTLYSKVLCDCGCRDVLGDCSHKKCNRKPLMQSEISSGIGAGKSDEKILKEVAAAHGTDILLVPTFQGFNTLLWIVPISLGLVAAGATLAVQRKRASVPKQG